MELNVPEQKADNDSTFQAQFSGEPPMRCGLSHSVSYGSYVKLVVITGDKNVSLNHPVLEFASLHSLDVH